jgi:hypothetical protein
MSLKVVERDLAVTLVSFNGAYFQPLGGDPKENYWKLIGWDGKIVDDAPPEGVSKDRVLVQFSCDVASQGLHCHNPVPNSLWISRVDLVAI